MCGEQAVMATTLITQLGSPPRVRGTVFENAANVEKLGITPACAGNRDRLVPGLYSGQDHPRVCGEQIPSPRVRGEVIGSPPRVRGTEMHDMYQRFHIGITPACAGNSGPEIWAAMLRTDHPRVCGEQSCCYARY